MKRIFLISTALFWLALAGFWFAGRSRPSPTPAPPPQTKQAETRRFSLDEVAKHDLAGDCWMAIDGQVYDLTAYIPQHPSRPDVIVRWCGKEATDAYNTKDRGRPHSDYAAALLRRFRIGALQETAGQ